MKKNRKGFTLVELVIVIAVIAILAAVLIPTFSSVIGSANKSSAEQNGGLVRTYCIAMHNESGTEFGTFDAFCEAYVETYKGETDKKYVDKSDIDEAPSAETEDKFYISEENVLIVNDLKIELATIAKEKETTETNFLISKIDEVWTMQYATKSGYVVTITASDKVTASKGSSIEIPKA